MPSFIDKLHIEYKDNPDGGGDITIEWDENDLVLAEWTSWSEDKQKQFILDALTIAVSDALPNDEIEPLRLD
jgi:hypothetical protein